MKTNPSPNLHKVKAPKSQGNARLCDRYYDGSKYMVAIKSGKTVRIVSLRYFIKALTKDVPPEAYQ